MAAASSALCQDQFLCSICLNTFEEPVSTPCGHNYCKSCITAYWDSKSSDLAQCPLCKKIFNSRPQLQVNTEFRDMLEHFSRFRLKNQQEVIAQPGEVPCDVCTGMKLRAHKTCLVCLASYCEPHLEPHRSLKKHKLIDPVPNLEDRVCKKHDKMLELFCLTDEQCICLMCLTDDHAAHNAVPLECIFLERKAILQNVTSELKKKENAQKISADMIKKSIQQNKKSKDKDVAEVVQVLGTLVASLQRKQSELIEVVKQKQETFEKQAEDHIKRLDQEVSDLSKMRSEIDQHLQTEDHLCFLQNCPPPPPVDCTGGTNPVFDLDVNQHVYGEMVKRSVARIEETLSDEMERLIHQVRSSSCEVDQLDAATYLTLDGLFDQLLSPAQDALMAIQQSAVNVTLDHYVANSKLSVSPDGRKLTLYPQFSYAAFFDRRFKYLPLALAKEGFSSGRFYYEVRVSRTKYWILGVVKESIDRGLQCYPRFEDGAYLMYGRPYLPASKAETVGVFVDYEMGEVSFYDVETRTLIHSFTGCTFTETTAAPSAFLFSLVGASPVIRPKLYPAFGLRGEVLGECLEITPVHGTNQITS